MTMKVVLFNNDTKDLASEAIETISDWLDQQGIEYDTISSGIFEAGAPCHEDLRDSIRGADLMCTFGGDGTILRAAHLVGSLGVPLLCYNFGRLGFLAGARESDLIPALEGALAGELTRDARTMLEVKVIYEDGQSESQLAVNELVVSRGHFGRIVALDLLINDSFVDTMRGDGVLVATPTGSTAYALSAGGPIISPANEGLCIVPISPHSLTSRAVVTARDDVIRLVPNELNRQQLVLFIDGQVLWITSEDDPTTTDSASGKRAISSVEVRVFSQKLLLLRYGDYDFYEQIAETFFRGGHA
jgi:NAD+ kinase